MKTLRGYLFIVCFLIVAMSCNILSNRSTDVTTGGTPQPVEPADTPQQDQTSTSNESFSAEFVSLWNVEGGPNEVGDISHFTIDLDGNLVFVAVGQNAQHPSVFKFDTQGKFLTQWGEPGGGEGKFSSPTNVAVDGQGNIYVTDTNFYPEQLPIQKFDSDGKFLASVGSFQGDNALAWAGGIAVDSAGNIFVTDSSNKIFKFDASGKFLTSWSALAQEGDRGQYFDLTIDSEGNLYVLNIEGQGHLIKFDTNGTDLKSWPQLTCGTDYFSLANTGGVSECVNDLRHEISEFSHSC